MKRHLLYSGLIALWLLLPGCPYESKVPIDPPSVKINNALLGSWFDQSNKNAVYHISKQDEYGYHVVVTDAEKDEHEIYHAYTSLVKGTTFLNITKEQPGKTPSAYLLYKLEVMGDQKITLSEVTENIDETFATSSELKKYIGANMKNSYFFGKDITTLVRHGN